MSLAVLPSSMPSEHEMMVFNVMAKSAVESKMYKGIGDQAAVMMIMLSARELGIPAMQSLNGGLNIINGKVEISARMMSAMIWRAGHSFKIVESTETSCTIAGKRKDGETHTASYTFAEAQKAGLVKPNGGWVKNPKDMCFARALSRLARQLFSDVIGIGYIEGEIRATEFEPIMAEEPQSLQIEEKDLEDALDIYRACFLGTEQADAFEYLETVSKHFGWTVPKTIEELVKDKAKLAEKFESWKSKKNK